ncbi:hypothetical protein EUGRSUZ_K00205 [Eucalyptus grandis]|uniref:Uncharacterized protein n=2 Tax=Eucalyptus grandis TaxID=71139 RepID=A0ACC3IPK8_EUCGR|nr:hypothetical protein EUGRSUZ_K00205 [Eucalyptus grandis]
MVNSTTSVILEIKSRVLIKTTVRYYYNLQINTYSFTPTINFKTSFKKRIRFKGPRRACFQGIKPWMMNGFQKLKEF